MTIEGSYNKGGVDGYYDVHVPKGEARQYEIYPCSVEVIDNGSSAHIKVVFNPWEKYRRWGAERITSEIAGSGLKGISAEVDRGAMHGFKAWISDGSVECKLGDERGSFKMNLKHISE